MTDSRYDAAKSLFLAALAKPPDERAEFVHISAGDDAELAAHVLELLKDAPPEDALTPTQDSQPDFIADYRVLRELGRGGMGIVYLCERDRDGTRQRVALKRMLVAHPLDAARALGRFRAERQILAALDHPHVARLLDAGTDAGGSPFFAMEYVEGERIDRYADAQGLDARGRVTLIAKVARAVASAHRHFVVHRDLKPGNILVDAYGEPKLLDFGIAKLLDDSEIELSRVETTGAAALTPRYAAPEQVRGEPVSTATDVYALGVILFELLSGRSPYGDAASAPLSLPRAICEDQPMAPSAAARLQERLTSPGTTRVRDPIRGDLDAIVLKCLRKRPEDRYGGMEPLVADLEAWLDGKPVEARRGNRWYHARRFMSRHWLALATAASVVALVIVFVWSLARELDATAAERDRAGRERQRAEQVTAFMVDLFGEADPRQARGTEPTVRQALDRGATRLDTELREYPETRALLLRELAVIYSELGDQDRSLALANKSVALTAPLRTQAPLDHARARYAVAVALYEKGEHDNARVILDEVMANADAIGATPLALDARNRLGLLEGARERHELAARIFADLERKLVAHLGAQSLAEAYGLPITGESRDSLERLGRAGQNRCMQEQALGNPVAALRRCRAAEALKRRLWAPDHPVHLPTAIEIAILQDQLGDTQGSLDANRRIVALSRRIYGDTHVRTAFPMVNLAIDLGAVGRHDEALPIIREAVAIFETNVGRQHVWTQTAMSNLATVLMGSGDAAAALTLHNEVLPLQEQSAKGEDRTGIAETWMGIADAHVALANEAEAVVAARKGVAVFVAAVGESHPGTLEARVGLAQALNAAGEFDESVRILEAVLPRLTDEHREVQVAAEFALARALRNSDVDRARKHALSALEQARGLKRSTPTPAQIEQWLEGLAAQ